MLAAAFIFDKKEIRTFIDDDKSLWLCAKDICDSLGMAWSGDKTLMSIKPKWQRTVRDTASDGHPMLAYINESGLYKFISSSSKKEAETFMEWVYEVVLPSIRENGWYAHADTIDPVLLKNRLSIYEQKRKQVLAIRDTPPILNRSLIKDVNELCVMLGQSKLEIESFQQGELILGFSDSGN